MGVKYDNGVFTLTIPYKEVDLKKATLQGLELMMDILLSQEWYEKCSEVQNEINSRNTLVKKVK